MTDMTGPGDDHTPPIETPHASGDAHAPGSLVSTEHLVEHAVAGDRGARGDLMERHLPGLRAFVRLRLGRQLRHRDSSLDLVQSVCREALEGLDHFQYRGPDSFRNWLLRQAENKIRDRGRYWNRARRSGDREAGPLTAVMAQEREQGVELLGRLRTHGTPSRHAAAREELTRAEQAYASLPEDYQRVIELARVQGRPHQEVAVAMDRSVAATRTLLSRALARLAALLEASGPPGENSGER
jgi:RNA polymerase sigma factor (sigma-70 family)